MGKTVQVNKQTTIVQVNQKCCQTKRKKQNRKQKKYFIEKVCGVIFQKSLSPPQVYFRAIGVRPSATLNIQNDTNCDMEAIIKMRTKEITQTVKQSQQVSMVLPSLARLSIRWAGGESPICRGRYTIILRHGKKTRLRLY
ncbi:S-Ena type endospore appendage [Paenibacillus puerhi]|uniref:S-Ena type endospore appendage n=1 Tax=Paenibacillus puerhi TaxID=2692622 RepID=UPI001358BCD3|nr:S-Ena type endospore appendage [Paenibacillus puerhi]